MKKILLISPESWGKSFVSKHHYAVELAKKGNIVYFLNPPSHTNSVIKIHENLFLIDYKIRTRGLAKLPKFLSAFFIKKDVKFLEKLSGVVFSIIWNFDSSRFFNLSLIKNKTKICHIVDMAENINRDLLAKTSDICFCTSDFIKQELLPFNKNVHKIHHGYQIQKDNYELDETFDPQKLQVGYVGNLTRDCMDWITIFKLINQNPNIQFNFIGSYKASNLSRKNIENNIFEKLIGLKNVTLLGQKESFLIPSYLKKFNVLFTIYKMDNLDDVKQHSNLHKTMEYLGSGKTIITSYVDEYKDKKYLMEMVLKNSDIPALFNKITNNIDSYNSVEKQKERIQFSFDHSYSKQTNKILHLIQKL